MRTQKQQQKFNDFVEIMNHEVDLEKEITKAYIQQKQYLLLSQFEEVADVKRGEGIGSYFSTDDYDGIFREYYSNFYTSIMILYYYEYLEDYGMCNILKETIEMNRRILIDTLKSLVQVEELPDTITIVEISEDELKHIIQTHYGTNH